MRLEIEYLDDIIWLEWDSDDLWWCCILEELDDDDDDGESDDVLGGLRIENRPLFNSNVGFASSIMDALFLYK